MSSWKTRTDINQVFHLYSLILIIIRWPSFPCVHLQRYIIQQIRVVLICKLYHALQRLEIITRNSGIFFNWLLFFFFFLDVSHRCPIQKQANKTYRSVFQTHPEVEDVDFQLHKTVSHEIMIQLWHIIKLNHETSYKICDQPLWYSPLLSYNSGPLMEKEERMDKDEIQGLLTKYHSWYWQSTVQYSNLSTGQKNELGWLNIIPKKRIGKEFRKYISEQSIKVKAALHELSHLNCEP